MLARILGLASCDHGDGALLTISEASTGGCGSSSSSAARRCWPCSGVRVTLFGPFTHPLLGGTVTVFWIVGLTNSFNMLDNMDGLAASVGLIAAVLFCGAQIAVGSLFAPAVLLVVVGALAGFLVHNLRRPDCSWEMPAAISWGSCSVP